MVPGTRRRSPFPVLIYVPTHVYVRAAGRRRLVRTTEGTGGRVTLTNDGPFRFRVVGNLNFDGPDEVRFPGNPETDPNPNPDPDPPGPGPGPDERFSLFLPNGFSPVFFPPGPGPVGP
jgi:hypothetical protein